MSDRGKKQKLEPGAPPARRNRAEPVARNSGDAAAQALLRRGFRDASLVLRWREIAGADIARIAQPLKLSEGPLGATLTLLADPGAALFLQHESRSLIGRINLFLGRDAVVKLKFVQGALHKPVRLASPPKRQLPVPSGDPALSFDGAPTLRESLTRLAGTRLSSRQAD